MVEKGGMLLELGNEINVTVRRLFFTCARTKHINLSSIVLYSDPLYFAFQLLQSVKLTHFHLHISIPNPNL